MGRPIHIRALVTVGATALLTLCSCNAGVVRFVSLNATSIDPPPPIVWEFSADECVHWVDDAGNLNIAIHCSKKNLLAGKLGDMDLSASFALTTPPAGMGRDYSVHESEPRVLLSSPVTNMRFASFMGIVSMVRKGEHSYRGSFRLLMHTFAEQSFFNFLSANPGGVVCFGTFTTHEDRKRGEAIRAASEAGGWARPAKPAPKQAQPSSGTMRADNVRSEPRP